MFDQIQEIAKSDFSIWASNWIVEFPAGVNFFYSPTTHLVANVKDLTNVLEGTADEAEEKEEETNESTESRQPATSIWKETTTYDIYMVDTPNTSNNGDGDDDGNGQNSANGNNGDGPKSPPINVSIHEGESSSEFGAWDVDILNEFLCSARHDECRVRLIRSSKKVMRDREELEARAQFFEE